MAAHYDVLVIGEGVAGLTAAGELAKAGLKVATLEAQLFGGLVINVNELEPAPQGCEGGGAEYASGLMQTAADAGVVSLQEPVVAIESEGNLKKVITGESSYTAEHVIIASGAKLRKLGVPGEAEFEGRGVSQCADCDGPMYQNEVAIVVGGGDSALQEALVLAQYCKQVRIVHRGPAFKAQEHFKHAVAAESRIVKTFDAEVAAISGDQMVEKVQIKHKDGRIEDADSVGVFAYIGLEPNAEFVPAAIKRDAQGFIIANDNLETAMSGVWAVGAVRSGCGGLLDDAIADARKAAAAIRARLG